MSKIIILILAIVCISGCAGPKIKLSQYGQQVKVGKSDPTDNYSDMGSITAVDGSGCGAIGYKGTYDRAVILLKNKASLKGGDYVQIYTLTEPHFRPGCFDNEYKINGTLFKKMSESPSPVAIVEVDNTSDIKKLRDLKLLLDEGIITDGEFEDQKKKILSDGIQL